MKTFEEYIDQYIDGTLSSDDAKILEKMAADNPEYNNMYQAAKISIIATENEIREGTKDFLMGLSARKEKVITGSPSTRMFYLTGIAASIFIIIASFITINVSHSNDSIADKFNPNTLVYRDSESYGNRQYSGAMRAYFKGDFEEAAQLVSEMDRTLKIDNDYAEWLELLIMLKTSKSKTKEFEDLLSKITGSPEHQYYEHGQEMLRWIDHPWRSFVVGK